MSNIDTIFVPKEHKLTLSTNGLSKGSYSLLDTAGNPTDYNTIAESQVVTLNAENDGKSYKVKSDVGTIVSNITFDGTSDNRLDELTRRVSVSQLDTTADVEFATVTLSFTDAAYHKVTISEDCTLAFTFPENEVQVLR